MMKKTYILKIMLFVVGFALLLYVTVFRHNPYLQFRSGYYIRLEGYVETRSPAILLGDSHAAIIPQEYLPPDVYNLSYGSDGIQEMFVKVQFAFHHNPGLKTVFLSVDDQMFSLYREGINNQEIIDEIRQSKFEITKNRLFNMRKWPVFNRNVYVFIRRNIIQWFAHDIFERKGLYVSRDKEIESAVPIQLKAKQRVEDQIRGISQKSIETYRLLIQFCSQRGAKVVGVQFPVSPDFYQYADIMQLERIEDARKSLLLSEILNYRDIFQEKSYFIDIDHLSDEGLKAFQESLRTINKE